MENFKFSPFSDEFLSSIKILMKKYNLEDSEYNFLNCILSSCLYYNEKRCVKFSLVDDSLLYKGCAYPKEYDFCKSFETVILHSS